MSNHKDEAERLAEFASDEEIELTRGEFLALAQVHATLAVAEQLRIANYLARTEEKL